MGRTVDYGSDIGRRVLVAVQVGQTEITGKKKKKPRNWSHSGKIEDGCLNESEQ